MGQFKTSAYPTGYAPYANCQYNTPTSKENSTHSGAASFYASFLTLGQ